jgi:hypothetical protein
MNPWAGATWEGERIVMNAQNEATYGSGMITSGYLRFRLVFGWTADDSDFNIAYYLGRHREGQDDSGIVWDIASGVTFAAADTYPNVQIKKSAWYALTGEISHISYAIVNTGPSDNVRIWGVGLEVE